MAGTAEIVVLGARGRMGQMVLQACAQKLRGNPSALKVIGAIEAPGSKHVGEKTGVEGIDVAITDQLEPLLRPGVSIIDFTSPQASLAALAAAKRKGAGHVICTT